MVWFHNMSLVWTTNPHESWRTLGCLKRVKVRLTWHAEQHFKQWKLQFFSAALTFIVCRFIITLRAVVTKAIHDHSLHVAVLLFFKTEFQTLTYWLECTSPKGRDKPARELHLFTLGEFYLISFKGQHCSHWLVNQKPSEGSKWSWALHWACMQNAKSKPWTLQLCLWFCVWHRETPPEATLTRSFRYFFENVTVC